MPNADNAFALPAGTYRDLPAPIYHAQEAMSATGARRMLRSQLHYRMFRTTPHEATAAQQFGTAVHSGVLEPATFAKAVIEAPEVNLRTNAGKAEWAELVAAHPGAVILKAEDYARALGCIEAVAKHPAASVLLDGGDRELSVVWNDKEFNVRCKSRFDAFNRGGVVDLKTCADASREAFGRSAATYQYHVQAAHYISGSEHCLHETPRFFVFVCVESEAPFAVACYVLESNAILVGQHLMAVALRRYAAAISADEWPGYPETIEVLSLPRWALTLPAGLA